MIFAITIVRRRSGRGAGDAGESVAGVCGGSTSACPPLSLLEDGALAFNQSLSVWLWLKPHQRGWPAPLASV